MSNCPFCDSDSPTERAGTNPADGKPSTGFLRRAWLGTQWLFPTALLVLMPKCPLCVVAYVAMFTGIGITVATARWIQILMVVICVSSLAWLTFKLWRRRVLRRSW